MGTGEHERLGVVPPAVELTDSPETHGSTLVSRHLEVTEGADGTPGRF
jgi:hypothetical protein